MSGYASAYAFVFDCALLLAIAFAAGLLAGLLARLLLGARQTAQKAGRQGAHQPGAALAAIDGAPHVIVDMGQGIGVRAPARPGEGLSLPGRGADGARPLSGVSENRRDGQGGDGAGIDGATTPPEGSAPGIGNHAGLQPSQGSPEAGLNGVPVLSAGEAAAAGDIPPDDSPSGETRSDGVPPDVASPRSSPAGEPRPEAPPPKAASAAPAPTIKEEKAAPSGKPASRRAGAGTPAPLDLFTGLPSAPVHPGVKPPVLTAPDAGKADNLKLLKGIGPANEKALHRLGVFHFRQIAAWTAEEAEWVGSYLAFPGRIEREDWIGQAKALLSGARPEDLHQPRRK